VHEQWPIIGRADLYYGGTTYENKQGLGVQLPVQESAPAAVKVSIETLRADEEHWLAVPVTRLYDLGITVATSPLLAGRSGQPSVWLHPDSAGRLGVEAGGQVKLGGARLEVRIDPGMPSMVALVPRSMGIPVHAPAIVEIKKA
jgi:NADH-quinone oxidoreductase subunit G